MLAGIAAYKVVLAPLTGGSCRFLPSCSEYAEQAVRIHGALAGLLLASRRVGRCHPWGPHGLDPVPPARVPDK